MSSSPSLDDFIERIVREVIRRLQAMDATKPEVAQPKAAPVTGELVLSERLVTAATILGVPKGTTKVVIAKRAILTPLARDEARDRGIKIDRAEKGQPS
jgi:hypothetical protein